MRRGFATLERADDRNAELQGNALADEGGLIVSALEKARPVQRDRDDHVDRTRKLAPELVPEQPSERPGEIGTVAVFQQVNGFPDVASHVEEGKRAVPGARRLVEAFRADVQDAVHGASAAGAVRGRDERQGLQAGRAEHPRGIVEGTRPADRADEGHGGGQTGEEEGACARLHGRGLSVSSSRSRRDSCGRGGGSRVRSWWR